MSEPRAHWSKLKAQFQLPESSGSGRISRRSCATIATPALSSAAPAPASPAADRTATSLSIATKLMATKRNLCGDLQYRRVVEVDKTMRKNSGDRSMSAALQHRKVGRGSARNGVNDADRWGAAGVRVVREAAGGEAALERGEPPQPRHVTSPA
ncbi:unnamed protein product [Phytophthora fragariaefolia]|uniref:Unnamed protein product n=1 Tax=Phytophthora fragariaefolia TaxID=1490495 RepID=A0A9W6TRL4_9STRA|nr:unnamed protein product [Phytophthora fragariaefolia]